MRICEMKWNPKLDLLTQRMECRSLGYELSYLVWVHPFLIANEY
jgi:hypothetical protein